MTLFGQYGEFKVWGAYNGAGQHEFQVRRGNRILSRHARGLAAMDDAKVRHRASPEYQQEVAALRADIDHVGGA
jgi:hypothetical protein